MSEQQKEMLSALFDDESSDFEMRRLLAELKHDDIQKLRRYQLLRDACKKQISATHLTMDVSLAVSERLAQEQSSVESASKSVAKKPLLGFATAAAIAFVSVFGFQQWQEMQSQEETGFVAEGNVSASQLPLSQSPGLSTASAKSVLTIKPSPENRPEQNQQQPFQVDEIDTQR